MRDDVELVQAYEKNEVGAGGCKEIFPVQSETVKQEGRDAAAAAGDKHYTERMRITMAK